MPLTQVSQDMIVQLPKAPAFGAFLNASQSVVSAAWTKILAASEEFDTDGFYDTALARFTPTVAGYYQVTGKLIGVGATTASSMIIAIYKNGVQFKTGPAYISTGTNTMYAGVDALVYLNGTTDYLEAWGVVTGTGATTFTAGQSNTYWSAVLARSA